MEIAVGEDHKAAVLGTSVLARLLLAHQRVLVLGLGLENDEGKALLIEQKKVNKAILGGLEVLAQRVQIILFNLDIELQADVGRAIRVRKESPASGFQQLVDFDAGSGFLIRQLIPRYCRADSRAIIYHDSGLQSGLYWAYGFFPPGTAQRLQIHLAGLSLNRRGASRIQTPKIRGSVMSETALPRP